MSAAANMTVEKGADGALLVRVAGAYRHADSTSLPEEVRAALDEKPAKIAFDASALEDWDSTLLILVNRIVAASSEHEIEVDTKGLPDGVQRLIALARAAPANEPEEKPPRPPLLARIGLAGFAVYDATLAVLTFLGELAFSIVRLATGRAKMRRQDLFTEIAAAGVQSLGIVAVVSFLLGMILAFVGGVTLKPFGATIYVANVVTVAMLRELGAVMTAIVMAGRTGSAYAAQLGTMKVTQEIDALTTMALPPSDFLVLPRVLALSLMMPLLVIYADFIAVLGGGLIAVLSGTPVAEFMHQVQICAPMRTFWIGLVKGIVFGIVVAICGCIDGLRAKGGAAAVGNAATSAVVHSIVWIIVIDGLFAVLLDVLKL